MKKMQRYVDNIVNDKNLRKSSIAKSNVDSFTIDKLECGRNKRRTNLRLHVRNNERGSRHQKNLTTYHST